MGRALVLACGVTDAGANEADVDDVDVGSDDEEFEMACCVSDIFRSTDLGIVPATSSKK